MSDSPCGDDGIATETRYIEILEFTHFVRFFNFHTLDINSKEKRLVDRITVVACGDDGIATETRYIEILEFTHFVRFFNFHTLDINSKEKRLVDRITVVVALDIVTKDTK